MTRTWGVVGCTCASVIHIAAYMLSFPSFHAWPLACASLIPLTLVALRARRLRVALMATLITQMLMQLFMNRWLVDVTAVGYPFMCLYLTFYPLIYISLVRRMSLTTLPMTLVMPVVWTGLECLRGELIFNGYPWYLLGHPLVEWPVLAQSTDLFGAYVISFLAAMCSGAALDLYISMHVSRRTRRLPVAIASLVFVANLAYGWWRTHQPIESAKSIRATVIQTNLPQNNKIRWSLQNQIDSLEEFIELTRDAFVSMEVRPDLLVWPETMFPGFGLDQDAVQLLYEKTLTARWQMVDDLLSLHEELQAPLLVGSPCYTDLEIEFLDARSFKPVWKNHFNSAYLVQGDFPYQRYDKVFLTPFGEVMPYISRWPWLEDKLMSLGAQGMSFTLDAGSSIELITVPYDLSGSAGSVERSGAFTIATPICFEDTMSRVCKAMAWNNGEKQIDAFINLSNDGWFGDNDAGRAHHAQIARFRCIENRVPMLRAANTGLSVAIDSNGKVIGRIGSGRYGSGRRADALTAELRSDARRTVFGRIGNLWAWFCLVLTILGLGWTLVTSGKRSS